MAETRRPKLGDLVHRLSPADGICAAAFVAVIGQTPPTERGPRVGAGVVGTPGVDQNLRYDPTGEVLPHSAYVPPTDRGRAQRRPTWHYPSDCPQGL